MPVQGLSTSTRYMWKLSVYYAHVYDIDGTLSAYQAHVYDIDGTLSAYQAHVYDNDRTLSAYQAAQIIALQLKKLSDNNVHSKLSFEI